MAVAAMGSDAHASRCKNKQRRWEPLPPHRPRPCPVRAAIEDTCVSADGVDRHRPRSGGAQGARFIPFRGFDHLAGRGFVPLCLSPCARQGTSRLRCGDMCRMRGAPAVRGSAAREGCAELPDGVGKEIDVGGFRDWGLGQPQIGLPQPRDNPCHGMAWHGLSPDGVLPLPQSVALAAPSTS